MSRKKPFPEAPPPSFSDTAEREVLRNRPSGVSGVASGVRDGEEPSSVRATDPMLLTAETPVPTTTRQPTPTFDAELPATVLDRLLTAAAQLPFAHGEDAVARAVVDALADVLPACAVGACLVRAQDHEDATRGRDVRQRVIRKHPEGARARDGGVDPTRLFPGFAAEVVLPIPGDGAGSSLHVASDDVGAIEHGTSAYRAIDRAARLLGPALEQARVHRDLLSARGRIDGLRSQMVQAEKLASLGQIAAGMVHELNNPLTSIVAYTDFLTKRWMAKRDQVDADEIERLRRIGESAHRLLRFTRDLVSYARPSGDVPIPVVIHGVIDQALLFCEHLVSEHRVEVRRYFGDGILPVRGLPEQLTQVFVNLVTNACHAMPGGGAIEIRTELVHGDRQVQIAVEDSGHGIPPAHVPRVFDPFFTTKPDGHGTGLGLSIVKSIVESHGGRITVVSEPHHGARFLIVLPVASR